MSAGEGLDQWCGEEKLGHNRERFGPVAEEAVSPGLQSQKSKAKGSHIIPTPSQQNLPLAQLSDFGSKKSQNLRGRIQAYAKFPSHHG